MKRFISMVAFALIAHGAFAQSTAPVPVTVDNFVRAESDLYLAGGLKEAGGLAKLAHRREVAAIDQQTVIRLNRDTLYSSAVVDLDAGPVTITLPDAGKRFMSLMVLNQDHYVHSVVYKPGAHTYTRAQLGTRYMLVAVRTLVNPVDAEDVKTAHALQDRIRLEQNGSGKFEVPNWDPVSQKKVRDALLVLNTTIPDLRRAFGAKKDVDPIRHLIGAASGWGGNPDKDAIYLNVAPAKNDGSTVHQLVARQVPVDGFWSISLYNDQGYYEKNALDAYTVNNLTAKREADGSVRVQFGGCDAKVANCLPIMKGWNYMVRLYRPRAEVLNGQWKFPVAQPLN